MLDCLLLLPADRDLLSRGISSVSGGREELMNDDVVCGVPGVQQTAVRCGVRADSAAWGLFSGKLSEDSGEVSRLKIFDVGIKNI